MRKANEPAYPVVKTDLEDVGVYGHTKNNTYSTGGPTMREKLAMEIYVEIIRETPVDIDKLVDIKIIEMSAQTALRAADIFFEQLNK